MSLKPFDLEAVQLRLERMKPTPEELTLRREIERILQTTKLTEAIAQIVRKQFGVYFEGTHLVEKTANLSSIVQHIQDAFAKGTGAFYSGGNRSGKTHVLLEMYKQLVWQEWEAYHIANGYPDPFEFSERICHYTSSYRIFELLRRKEKLPMVRYIFIDDFGAEETNSILLSGLDEYIREIHARESALLIASPFQIKDLEAKPGYRRMLSRIGDKCRFYELPNIDRGKMETTKNTHSWRC